MTAGTPRWWENATAEEAAACRDEVRAFFKTPDAAYSEKFAKAFALLVLLGGDGDHASIRNAIGKVEDLHLDEICIGLEDLEKRLSDFPAALPDGLLESIDQLKKRRQKRNEDLHAHRMDILLRHARTYKLKPRTKG